MKMSLYEMGPLINGFRVGRVGLLTCLFILVYGDGVEIL